MVSARTSRGFTLMELIMTLVITAILAGTGYVSFKAVIDSNADRDATALIDRVVQAETRFARTYNTYTGWPADLEGTGPGLTIVTGPVSTSGQVSLARGASGAVGFTTMSDNGTCHAMWLPAVNDVNASGPQSSVIAATAFCEGAAALTGSDPHVVVSGTAKW